MTFGSGHWTVRVVATSIVVAFVVVATITTVVSVGRYCLTSDGGDTAALPPSSRDGR